MLNIPFTQSQITGLLGLGTILWVAGVIKIRFAGHLLYVSRWGRIGTLLATVPFNYGLIIFPEAVFDIPSTRRVAMVNLLSATTLMMHGVAMTWFPVLYENESLKKTNPRSATVLSRIGAGWLLYGTGISLALASLTQ